MCIRDRNQIDTGLMDFIWATQNSVHEVGLLVPRSSIVSVGRTPGEHEPCVCPAPAGRRPLIIGVEYCLAGSSPLKLDFIKNLKIGVDGGWWVGDRKTQDNQRGWTGGCWHAAPTSGDETKILTVGKKRT